MSYFQIIYAYSFRLINKKLLWALNEKSTKAEIKKRAPGLIGSSQFFCKQFRHLHNEKKSSRKKSETCLVLEKYFICLFPLYVKVEQLRFFNWYFCAQ